MDCYRKCCRLSSSFCLYLSFSTCRHYTLASCWVAMLPRLIVATMGNTQTGRFLWAKCKSLKNVRGMSRVRMKLQTSARSFCTYYVYIFWYVKSCNFLAYHFEQSRSLVVRERFTRRISNWLHLNQFKQ